jgi:hypothetical protein
VLLKYFCSFQYPYHFSSAALCSKFLLSSMQDVSFLVGKVKESGADG